MTKKSFFGKPERIPLRLKPGVCLNPPNTKKTGGLPLSGNHYKRPYYQVNRKIFIIRMGNK
jgi:hypothetical protein